MIEGAHKSIPVGTVISFTSTDSRPVMLHVFYEAASNRHGGWDSSLADDGWVMDGVGPHWVDVVGANGDNLMCAFFC